ncbi:cytochrome c oxidase assembly protein [Alkalihalobacillus pseudalcaliphilus]|uniref:cytochrome c oxidase assembly protein n=1 Tax=Alkalihalobacillus pseudalcaliphilus TaxID=79884 RepID=UPI00064D738E|nr:cytochrome c oxidase assembly protein [Alkalihalobacillus pseudalcaliphilus]KMK76873.1 hypothetical protein AB990_08240 [Alkalihalobacillus pseudalcaliphilus]
MAHDHLEMEYFTFMSMSISLFCALIFIGYFTLALIQKNYKRRWPWSRIFYMFIACSCLIMLIFSPIVEQSHEYFSFHMLVHLVVGMFAPLMIVLAAPFVLIVRSLPVRVARIMIRICKSLYFRIVLNPYISGVINIGGLWVLYTTPLYTLMHEYALLNIIIHLHIFIAGYFFTLSLVYIEPVFHRKKYYHRFIALIISIALHGMLAKYLYIHPPVGVDVVEAQKGVLLMYYGGDIVDGIIMFIIGYQWYLENKMGLIVKEESVQA